jgi:hypothetical protein
MDFPPPVKSVSLQTGESLSDEFLSEEDLDLRNLSEAELIAYWNQWLE